MSRERGGAMGLEGVTDNSRMGQPNHGQCGSGPLLSVPLSRHPPPIQISGQTCAGWCRDASAGVETGICWANNTFRALIQENVLANHA